MLVTLFAQLVENGPQSGDVVDLPDDEAAELIRCGYAAPAEAPGEDLSALKKADLVTLATERGVDTSGTKAELVARLTDVDDD
jgi:hypothetical protein